MALKIISAVRDLKFHLVQTYHFACKEAEAVPREVPSVDYIYKYLQIYE